VTAAVVLCAGVGSRMGLPSNINKCATSFNNTSSVRHTVTALLNAGVKHIVVVVGHAEESVRNALADVPFFNDEQANIHFVVNEHYNFHGCNYSVACGLLSLFNAVDRVIIAEGDSLLHPNLISQVVESSKSKIAVALVRNPSYINPLRSVIAIGGENEKITRYAYDQSHTGELPTLTENESILGESMQLWAFSKNALKELSEIFYSYKLEADNSNTAMLESGVYSINNISVSIPIETIIANEPIASNGWLNLNTLDDLRKAEEIKWVLK